MLTLYSKYNYFLLSTSLNRFCQELTKTKNWNARYKKYISPYFFKGLVGIDYLSSISFFKNLDLYLTFFFKTLTLFFFISISKCYSFMMVNFEYIQSKVYSYFVYDWIFGIMANFRRIFSTYDLRSHATYLVQPQVALLVQTDRWTYNILQDLRANFVFTFGVIDLTNVVNMDFPLPLADTLESSFFVLRYFTLQSSVYLQKLGYSFIKESQIKIKYLQKLGLKNAMRTFDAIEFNW